MKKIFDDLTIKNLKPTDTMYACMAEKEPGLGIRVYPNGRKSFFYQYKIDGNRRFMNLGADPYPTTSLKTARDLYHAEAAKVKALRRGSKDGSDPVLEKKREKERRVTEEAEHQKALSVTALCEEYIKRHAKKFKKSWEADERLLNVEVIPVWGKRKAADISKRDVTLLLESIIDRGAPGMSNQVLKITRKMFNFAVERDILKHTPFTGVKALAPSISRERVLSESEIKTFWNNLATASISEEIQSALKLVLLTAQRPGEVSDMHTDEIDGHWWTIPAERAKNGKEHRVYLSATSQEIISQAIERVKLDREIPEGKDYSGYIFPCPHKKKVRAIDSHALPVAVRRNLAWPMTDKNGKQLFDKDGNAATENKLGIDKFTPHDLRRTAATLMAGMGFMDEIIDACLNHVKQGVIRTYNRHGYDKEKQQALESLELKINGIINSRTDSKVIPFAKKKA